MPRRIQKEIARDQGPLSARLSEYSAIAKAWDGARRFQRKTGGWQIYAAATGSALAMATSASAGSIVYEVYSSPAVVSPLPFGASSIKGLGIASGQEVNLFAKSGTMTGEPFVQLELQAINPVKIFLTGASSAKDFAFGSKIGGAFAGATAIVQDFFTATFFGKFQSGQAGFAGIYFSTAGHQKDYGWIELGFTEQAGEPYYLEALAWGIDTTPGQTIMAGQISAPAPEPGTMGLAILAAGAAGVEALRRRRKRA